LGFETSIGEEYLKLWDADNIVSLNEGYEILGNLPMTLGIGDNGAGEFIALEKLETGNFRVVLTPYIDLNKECYVEIGDSFSDFLLRTDNGEKWFK
jgi:hypothetical protein